MGVVEMGVSRERFPRQLILEPTLKSEWSFQARKKGNHFRQHQLGKILKAGESKKYPGTQGISQPKNKKAEEGSGDRCVEEV